MKENHLVITLLVVSYLLLSINIDGLSIYALDEAKNAECAREMMERGDWIVPTFNYQLRTDKPPLHYYFMIVSYQLFGVNEFSARFFSVIMGVLTIVVTYLFTKKYLSQEVGLLSSLILLASLHYAIQFNMAVPDPYLIFLMTASLFSFFVFFKEHKNTYLYLFYVGLGLGTLTKGPVAIALPGLIILLFLIFKKQFNWRIIKSFKIPLGIIIFLAVALPWYLAVALETNGEWTEQFFLKHNLRRYTDEMEGHGGIFLLTFAFVFAGMLPFAVFIIQGFWHTIKSRLNDVMLYCLISASVVIGFFAISGTKLPNYTVPSYPFLAIMIGYFLYQKHLGISGINIQWSYWFFTIIAMAFPIGIYFGLGSDPTLSHLQSLWVYFTVVPVGALIALILFYRKQLISSWLIIAASFIILNIFFFKIIMPKIDRQNPVITSLPKINKDYPIVSYRIFNPSFVFYLQQKIPGYSSSEELARFTADHPGSYILTRNRYWEDDLSKIPNLIIIEKEKDLLESTTTLVLRVNE